jgi:hypothetical protein
MPDDDACTARTWEMGWLVLWLRRTNAGFACKTGNEANEARKKQVLREGVKTGNIRQTVSAGLPDVWIAGLLRGFGAGGVEFL